MCPPPYPARHNRTEQPASQPATDKHSPSAKHTLPSTTNSCELLLQPTKNIHLKTDDTTTHGLRCTRPGQAQHTVIVGGGGGALVIESSWHPLYCGEWLGYGSTGDKMYLQIDKIMLKYCKICGFAFYLHFETGPVARELMNEIQIELLKMSQYQISTLTFSESLSVTLGLISSTRRSNYATE